MVIAHRLSTVRHCDRIVLLTGGAVEASGSFDELVAHSDHFASLVRHAGLARVVPPDGHRGPGRQVHPHDHVVSQAGGSRVLHVVVPTVGRPTVQAVIRRALAHETSLARLTVVSQACPPVVDGELLRVAAGHGVLLEEHCLPSRVGAALARLVGAGGGGVGGGGGGEEFVGFLDDDIAFEAGSLSDLVARCLDRGLGGACGVVTNAPENTRFHRLVKGVFFRSIFRDPRSAAVVAPTILRSPVLSGGVTVLRRRVFDLCADSLRGFPSDYSWGEDFELSYQASLVSVLAIDPSVRVRNEHLGLSRFAADRDVTADTGSSATGPSPTVTRVVDGNGRRTWAWSRS